MLYLKYSNKVIDFAYNIIAFRNKKHKLTNSKCKTLRICNICIINFYRNCTLQDAIS